MFEGMQAGVWFSVPKGSRKNTLPFSRAAIFVETKARSAEHRPAKRDSRKATKISANKSKRKSTIIFARALTMHQRNAKALRY